MNNIVNYSFSNTALEFICAQSPYSMRGLLIGMIYLVDGIFAGLAGLALLVTAKVFEHRPITSDSLSCGSVYYLVVFAVGLLGTVAYFVAAVWYRRRQRGGHEFVNERAILESYYEHVVQVGSL